jgi:hypothetical protein
MFRSTSEKNTIYHQAEEYGRKKEDKNEPGGESQQQYE